jgi:hypothetical protein
MTMRTLFIGLLAVTVVVAGAAWFANRSPGDAEVQRGGRAPDPVAADSAVAHPGLETSKTTESPAPVPGETDVPDPARADRPELVTLDPPPPTASGPTLESTGTVPDATIRDELVTVPVDADPAQTGRRELETVPADPSESARRDERADAPVPGQGNTSTR